MNKISETKGRITEFYNNYRVYQPALFFSAGFIFDILTLGRIDSLLNILQQAAYLILIVWLLRLELSPPPQETQGKLKTKLFESKEALVHSFFGSLLNAYAIFYFKSASFATAFLFLLFMAALLIFNELHQFRRYGKILRWGLLSLSMFSYFAYVIPIMFRFVGYVPFLFSALLTGILTVLLFKRAFTVLPEQKELQKKLKLTMFGVQAAFVALYFLDLIPPVPLSLRFAGIYHNVTKEAGMYKLSTEKEWWEFWHNGDQSFSVTSGDKIFLFISVFGPSQFEDNVKIRWEFKDPKFGWNTIDVVNMSIKGGREEGFRGFIQKNNFPPPPAKMRVKVETTDGREIGRIGFSTYPVESSPTRFPRRDSLAA